MGIYIGENIIFAVDRKGKEHQLKINKHSSLVEVHICAKADESDIIVVLPEC